MKKPFKLVYCLALLFLTRFCFSQTVASPYQIGTWRGFRDVALSYTYDDGCLNQLAIAVPMFNEFGYKLTLFTITGSANWYGLGKAAAQGHEIASHTVTHPVLSSLSSSNQTNELKNSQDQINAHITNQKCVTIAYPNCANPGDAIVGQFYIAGRNCQNYVESKTPMDFLNISSIPCGSAGYIQTAADLNDLAASALSTGGWCVYLIHGIDSDGGYSPLSSTSLRENLNYVSSNRDKYWVETFGNVVRYIKERDSVSVSVITNQKNLITVHVTDPLDDSIFNYPITIRCPLPAGWSSCLVRQHGTNIQSLMTNSTIMFDVVPDSGDITLNNSTRTNWSAGAIIPVKGGTYNQTNLLSTGMNFLRVVFPAGFSSKPVTFSAVVSDARNSSDVFINSNMLRLTRFISSEEYSLMPVQFTLKYPDVLIPPGHTESQLSLYSYNGIEWIRISGTLVTSSNLFIFNSNKLSGEYAFFVTDPNYIAANKKPGGPDVSQWSYNPFSPNGDNKSDVTRMELNLVKTAKVDVRIFDRNHRLIRDLCETMKVSGKTTIEWDGKDDKGKIVAPGSYIYIIRINDALRKGLIVVAY